MSTEKKTIPTTMIIGLVAVVAAIAYFGNKFPTAGDGAEGTVAPAARETGQQISGDQVQLDDETVAQVMQTDVYQLIITDAAFAEAMQSDAFRSLLQSDVFLSAMRSDAFRDAMREDAFISAMRADAFRGAMREDAFASALRNDAWLSAMRGDAFANACLLYTSDAADE